MCSSVNINSFHTSIFVSFIFRGNKKTKNKRKTKKKKKKKKKSAYKTISIDPSIITSFTTFKIESDDAIMQDMISRQQT
jgi:3D (Asp-Asp-Asp) domain-containing protein